LVDVVEQRLAPTMDSTSPSDMQVHSKEHPCQMENSVTALFTVAESFVMLVVCWWCLE